MQMMYALWTLPWLSSGQSRETLTFASFGPGKIFPKAPGQAADTLLSDLDPKSIEALIRINLEDLADYDQPLGEYCRNALGLDGRNKELIEACGSSDANDAIGVVIRLAWIKACETRNSRQGRSAFSP